MNDDCDLSFMFNALEAAWTLVGTKVSTAWLPWIRSGDEGMDGLAFGFQYRNKFYSARDGLGPASIHPSRVIRETEEKPTKKGRCDSGHLKGHFMEDQQEGPSRSAGNRS